MAKLKKEDLLEMYRKMEDIRNFDNKVNQLVRRGEVPGMTHFSVAKKLPMSVLSQAWKRAT